MRETMKPRRTYLGSTEALDLSYLELQENDSIENRDFCYDESLNLAIETNEKFDA